MNQMRSPGVQLYVSGQTQLGPLRKYLSWAAVMGTREYRDRKLEPFSAVRDSGYRMIGFQSAIFSHATSQGAGAWRSRGGISSRLALAEMPEQINLTMMTPSPRDGSGTDAQPDGDQTAGDGGSE